MSKRWERDSINLNLFRMWEWVETDRGIAFSHTTILHWLHMAGQRLRHKTHNPSLLSVSELFFPLSVHLLLCHCVQGNIYVIPDCFYIKQTKSGGGGGERVVVLHVSRLGKDPR